MPRRPATITQADVARTIRAAKQAGASEIEVRLPSASILVRLTPLKTPEVNTEPADEIIL